MYAKHVCGGMLALVLAGTAAAGEIYGTLWMDGKVAGNDLQLELVTPGKPAAGIKIDAGGAYRFYIDEQGKFTLRVSRGKQQAEMVIRSYENPVRYDLFIETKGGQLTLRRK